MVAATADVVGGDLGVGEQGLGLGVVQQRHGGASVRRCSMTPSVSCFGGKALGKV